MVVNSSPSVLERFLYRIPPVAYTIRLLETENFKELAMFGGNVLGYSTLLVGFFGYQVFIVLLLAAVALLAALIFSATLG